MSQFTKEFFERIQYQGDHNVTFEDLPALQLQFAKTVPFENISIMSNEDIHVTLENIRQKILNQKRGGVCYELNPMFYSFLNHQGFDVSMVAGTVFLENNHQGLHRTHIATLLQQDGKQYIVDVGFGKNHALQPVPMTGETVTSFTGEYRIKEVDSPWGEYSLEKYCDGKLEIQYTFSTDPVDESHLDKVKDVITHHDHSPFNKSILLSKLTNDGTITLTDHSLTITKHNKKTQHQLNQEVFKQMCRDYFQIDIQQYSI